MMTALASHKHSGGIQPVTTSQTASRVTELVNAFGEPASLLLPVLRHLTEQDEHRWLTVICSGGLSQHWLRQQNLNPRTLRIIRADSPESALWMTWEALANGTSHTVVAEIGQQPAQVMSELELAARQGECRALLVRGR